MITACPPAPTSTIADASQITNPSNPYEQVEVLLSRGDDAYENKQTARAISFYLQAAASIIATPSKNRRGYPLDSQLHLARVLAVLDDRKTANVLWKLVATTSPNPFTAQAAAIKRHDVHALFVAMAADGAIYTGGHPDDDKTKDDIARGVAAGLRGDLKTAAHDFESGTWDSTYSPTYAYYALGTTQWFLGERQGALETWICGSDSGRPYVAGGAGSSGPANLAIATVLSSI